METVFSLRTSVDGDSRILGNFNVVFNFLCIYMLHVKSTVKDLLQSVAVDNLLNFDKDVGHHTDHN
jgi:hypothetical protein